MSAAEKDFTRGHIYDHGAECSCETYSSGRTAKGPSYWYFHDLHIEMNSQPKVIAEPVPLPRFPSVYRDACQRLGFDPRDQQDKAVQHIHHGSGLKLVEAGTGNGKSHIALVTAIDVARKGGRALISTGTTLLRQQYRKDVKKMTRLYPEVKIVQIGGASNYVCTQRARVSMLALNATTSTESRVKADLIRKMLKGVEDDVILEVEKVDRLIREYVAADTDQCNDDELCTADEPRGCSFRNARRLANAADVVVTVHALATINAVFDGKVIGDFDLTIYDEAHELSGVLRSQETMTFTGSGVRRMTEVFGDYMSDYLNDLASDIDSLKIESGAEKVRSGALSQASWLSPSQIETARSIGQRAMLLKDVLDQQAAAHQMNAEEAFRASDGDPQASRRHWLAKNKCLKAARRMWFLHSWSMYCTRPAELEVRQWVGSVTNYRVMSGELRTRLEVEPVKISNSDAVLTSAPTVVLMSATLGTLHKPTYVLDDLNTSLRGDYLRLDHVFDYKNAMVMRNIDGDHSWLDDILDSVRSTGGGALVLATSHGRKDEIYNHLFEHLLSEGITVYRQPKVENKDERAKIWDQFKSDENSVLVGTASYFQGVDAPGETLRHVVIADLPTPHFYAPLEQQRVVNFGKKTYYSESVNPRVEMNLEQMTGRLIRSTSDTGYITFVPSKHYKPNTQPYAINQDMERQTNVLRRFHNN